MKFPKKLSKKLENRKSANMLRGLQVSEGKDFYSNDYLGLARNKELREQVDTEYKKLSHLNAGSTGSRLLSGNSNYSEELEAKLAKLFGTESCLLLNSGYNANLSILQAVPQRGDTIIYDELIHASLKEGARLSFAKRFSFKHNDLNDLKSKLDQAEGDVYVVVESVYSMDGDESPLNDLVKLCESSGAYLIVDEAHSTAVYGAGGAGKVSALGLTDNVFATIYTFGKGLGCHGAAIAGSEELKSYLVNYANAFIYTTALPLHSLVTINRSFDCISKELQNQLMAKINLFKSLIRTDDWVASDSAIQMYKAGSIEKAKRLAQELQNEGFDVRAILSPTVKEGQERIRVCLHVFNDDEDIIELIKKMS